MLVGNMYLRYKYQKLNKNKIGMSITETGRYKLE